MMELSFLLGRYNQRGVLEDSFLNFHYQTLFMKNGAEDVVINSESLCCAKALQAQILGSLLDKI